MVDRSLVSGNGRYQGIAISAGTSPVQLDRAIDLLSIRRRLALVCREVVVPLNVEHIGAQFVLPTLAYGAIDIPQNIEMVSVVMEIRFHAAALHSTLVSA
jgi:hypothetical protein